MYASCCIINKILVEDWEKLLPPTVLAVPRNVAFKLLDSPLGLTRNWLVCAVATKIHT